MVPAQPAGAERQPVRHDCAGSTSPARPQVDHRVIAGAARRHTRRVDLDVSINSFGARGTLDVGDNSYEIYRLNAVEGTAKLPYALKVLAENLLRTEDGANITKEHIEALANWDPNAEPSVEIQFTPARVIMQDFTSVTCIVSLTTIRDAVK